MGVIVVTNLWQHDQDDDSDDSRQGGKDPVRDQLRKLEKQNKDLMEKLARAEASARTATIKDVLAEKKLPAKLANLIPANIDPTVEAISTWLKEYEDLFTPAPDDKAASDGKQDDSGDTSVDGVDEDYVAAMNAATRMAQVTAGGKTPASKPDDLLRQITDPTMTQEKLLALITQHGGGVGLG